MKLPLLTTHLHICICIICILLLSSSISLVHGSSTSTSTEPIYYWPFHNEDAPLQDLSFLKGATFEQLEAACSSNISCVGFNSEGYLKNASSIVKSKPHTTLYIKRTIPPPPFHTNIVPMPQCVTQGNTILGIKSKLTFTPNHESADLSAAFARYQALIFIRPESSRAHPYSIYLTTVNVVVADANVPLQLGADESYTLNIPSDGTASITAKTVYGVYHALETLSQLVTYNYLTRSYQNHSLILNSGKARSRFTRDTQDDVIEVIEYARQRGVRVMLEFDLPGHAGSWCVGYPEVCPAPNCTEPLNPTTGTTVKIIESLLGEVTGKKQGGGLAFENLLHLGGDEVHPACWKQVPAVADWLKTNNYTTEDAYLYFVAQANKIAIDQGRIPVHWEEVFTHFGNKLDPKTIINIWLNKGALPRAVAAGYRVILNDLNTWYLDLMHTPWENSYMTDPFTNITDPKQQALILGGEASVWGRLVDTSNLMQTTWPRAAAVAERLWSNANVNCTAEFLPRLQNFRCHLNQRGIAATPTDIAVPLTNKAAMRVGPPEFGSCYMQ